MSVGNAAIVFHDAAANLLPVSAAIAQTSTPAMHIEVQNGIIALACICKQPACRLNGMWPSTMLNFHYSSQPPIPVESENIPSIRRIRGTYYSQ